MPGVIESIVTLQEEQQWFSALGFRIRGPGFEPKSCHLDFIDWVSPTSKLQYD